MLFMKKIEENCSSIYGSYYQKMFGTNYLISLPNI